MPDTERGGSMRRGRDESEDESDLADAPTAGASAAQTDTFSFGPLAAGETRRIFWQVTPVARLTSEWEVIVVPADSEFQTLDDLIAAFQADPTAISWGGGSAGGTPARPATPNNIRRR